MRLPRSVSRPRASLLLGGRPALFAAVLLFSACATPFFERAAIEPGWSGGGGLGIGGGSFESTRAGTNYTYFCAHVAPKLTLFGRRNFSERFGLFAQFTTGVAYEISDQPARGFFAGFGPLAVISELAEAEIGAKFGPGERDALRVGLGTVFLVLPVLADVTWLHDLDESWTTNLGIGTRGLSGGLGYHFAVAKGWAGHLSLTGAASGRTDNTEGTQTLRLLGTGQLGFAVEALPRRPE